ncbi:unnamed protein product [Thelazia callipaeda]|uniref:Ovule protein n=1 Tax=Thelazia callipaeda TaxID=103827 RepID=A0A0N5D3P8_THECL|nr:unnamed protein product [Thelazia callipaeda]
MPSFRSKCGRRLPATPSIPRLQVHLPQTAPSTPRPKLVNTQNKMSSVESDYLFPFQHNESTLSDVKNEAKEASSGEYVSDEADNREPSMVHVKEHRYHQNRNLDDRLNADENE